jgi:cytochrome c biogenesis protein
MNLRKTLKSFFRFLSDLNFAVGLLLFLAFASSLGSFLEQDEISNLSQESSSLAKLSFPFLTSKIILFFGLDHIYRTWWFLLSLLFLGFSLVACTLLRQFPLVKNSKSFTFKKLFSSFKSFPFFLRIPKTYTVDQVFLTQAKKNAFFVYQKKVAIYAYKGLIGRISPVLVHCSLLTILLGSSLGAINTFKSQELVPKDEIFQVQNLRSIGKLPLFPSFQLRVNDFWIEYQEKAPRQFYSNLSVLTSSGEELTQQTISVNNPLRYKGLDVYQSDWNCLGIRKKIFFAPIVKTSQVEAFPFSPSNENYPCKKKFQEKTLEYPLFSLGEKEEKNLLTWIRGKDQIYTIVLNNFQEDYFIYTEDGKLLSKKNSQETFLESFSISDILPLTGLLIKYDPNIPIIYFGFGGLILTSFLSYLPYTQLWAVALPTQFWVASTTNRGKSHLEVQNESFLRNLS